MKTSLKLLLTLVALGLPVATPLAFAEDEAAPSGEHEKGERKKGGGRMVSPEERVAQIDKAVGGLTDDQKAKIKDIYAETEKTVREAMAGGDREKGREAMTATREKVRAVLTDEQKAKFDAMPARGQGGGGGKRDKKDK